MGSGNRKRGNTPAMRKRRKRKRIRLFVRLFVRAAVVVIAVNVLAGLLKNENLFQKRDESVFVDAKAADLRTPQKFEGGELFEELSELAETSGDFKEIYENRERYPEELLQALCSNPEMIDFAKGYLEAERAASGKITARDLGGRLPLFIQWDERWGYAPYGSSCVGLSGCAPTCLSMVIVGLTGNTDFSPDAVAQYAYENGYYVEGTGTAWSLMTEGSRAFGITGIELGLDEGAVMQRLENGEPVICSMRPGDFTAAGHFIVLAGIQDGKIIVNDPNSRKRSNALWEYDTLKGQIKNLWVFTKA